MIVHIHIYRRGGSQGCSSPKMKGSSDTYENKYCRTALPVTASHLDTLVTTEWPTNARLKVYVNLYKSPIDDLQIRNTSWRTCSGCLCHHRAGLDTTEIFHCNDVTRGQDTVSNPMIFFFSTIRINQRMFKAERRQRRVFQKQQVLRKWNDKSHFNGQCLYC